MTKLTVETLKQYLTRIGCSFDDAGPVSCICFGELPSGRCRIWDDAASWTGRIDDLPELPNGAGPAALWAALPRGEE